MHQVVSSWLSRGEGLILSVRFCAVLGKHWMDQVHCGSSPFNTPWFRQASDSQVHLLAWYASQDRQPWASITSQRSSIWETSSSWDWSVSFWFHTSWSSLWSEFSWLILPSYDWGLHATCYQLLYHVHLGGLTGLHASLVGSLLGCLGSSQGDSTSSSFQTFFWHVQTSQVWSQYWLRMMMQTATFLFWTWCARESTCSLVWVPSTRLVRCFYLYFFPLDQVSSYPRLCCIWSISYSSSSLVTFSSLRCRNSWCRYCPMSDFWVPSSCSDLLSMSWWKYRDSDWQFDAAVSCLCCVWVRFLWLQVAFLRIGIPWRASYYRRYFHWCCLQLSQGHSSDLLFQCCTCPMLCWGGWFLQFLKLDSLVWCPAMSLRGRLLVRMEQGQVEARTSETEWGDWRYQIYGRLSSQYCCRLTACFRLVCYERSVFVPFVV